MRTFLLLALLVPAFAAAKDTNEAAVGITTACRKDLRGQCKGAKGGPLKCLMDNKDKVEPACRKALDASKGATLSTGAAPAGSCAGEYVKVCKGVKSKELKACLKAHRDELPEHCRAAVDGAVKAKR